MLKKLTLENYRCFENIQIPFKELVIIIGRNNAGKSTLIEALRILSVVVNRCENLNYSRAPDWVVQKEGALGISPSIANLDISTSNIFYMYGEAPAKIIAQFEDGTKIEISVGEDAKVFATLLASTGAYVESKKFAKALKLPQIDILPQITPIRKTEELIQRDTVQRNIDTMLSSRNFRNQLYYYPAAFDKFKILAETTWQGLTIRDDPKTIRTHGNLLLFVRDNKFEAEIGWMGHGLQMWLQTIWFLSRCNKNSTVILDEPDVYMHADLQRRLIRLVRREFKQVIIATHSIEIMSDVEAENILPIINTKRRLSYAGNTPIVQKVIEEIGSVHNIEIARLFSHKKFLVVEGEKDDIKLLAIFQSKIFPDTFEPFDVLPKTFIEGWGGWQRVIGSSKFFKDNKSEVHVYCILDSDYHTFEEKQKRLTEANEHDIDLHIWGRKEIENYLLVPTAIYRVLRKSKKAVPSVEEITIILNKICDELKDDVIDNFATSIQSEKNTGYTAKTANQKARTIVNQNWDENKVKLTCGKQVITMFATRIQQQYGLSIEKFRIARELRASEIDKEIATLIAKIENSD